MAERQLPSAWTLHQQGRIQNDAQDTSVTLAVNTATLPQDEPVKVLIFNESGGMIKYGFEPVTTGSIGMATNATAELMVVAKDAARLSALGMGSGVYLSFQVWRSVS